MNCENSTFVNFINLKNMILDAVYTYVHSPRKIKRKHGSVVVSEPEKKGYKSVFMKLRLMDKFDSLPYGYV